MALYVVSNRPFDLYQNNNLGKKKMCKLTPLLHEANLCHTGN